ncbi:NAD-dependent epimerase/dehydratase family protein [Gammaproteobacteria bacterium]|nr:NAD-dependent epimerase/dehydratase family protein [Gammaproteobacteria bacterium]
MQDYLTYYKNKTVLVTGGAGAVGSNLVRALARLDAKAVIVLDDLSSGYDWNVPDLPNVLFVKGSVVDEIALKRVYGLHPEIVFHLAAFFANQNSVDYPERDLKVNGLGTLRVFEYAQLAGVQRVIYASSGCAIYGDAPLPLAEHMQSMYLSSPYQITKMLGELYANFFRQHHGLSLVKARLFNSYGPGEVPGQYRNVIPNFIYWALMGQALSITGNHLATRDFTYVDDVVDAMLRSGYFDAADGLEINIGSGLETPIRQLAEQVNTLTGNQSGVSVIHRRKWDTKDRLRADISRARQVLGYEPGMEFSSGLARTVDWFRDNWQNIASDAEFPPGSSSALSPLS